MRGERWKGSFPSPLRGHVEKPHWRARDVPKRRCGGPEGTGGAEQLLHGLLMLCPARLFGEDFGDGMGR